MKINPLLCSSCLLLTSMLAQAAPLLTVGTPGNSQLATPTLPSPTLGHLINFDALTPGSTFAAGTYASLGVTSISSPDGLLVEPYSTQSYPNELYDSSSAGTASITIMLAGGTTAIGIGIADSDPVSVVFQALAANGMALGSAFTESLASTESLVNTGNGYYVVSDITADIYGLRITETVGNANYSGLAIDDLQFAPEPSSILLMTAGVAILGSLRLRKRV